MTTAKIIAIIKTGESFLARRSAVAQSFIFSRKVIGRDSFNQIRFERVFGTLHHRQTIAALIVLDLIHDVVDQEHAAPGGLEEVGWIARVRNLLHVEALASIYHGEAA